MAGENKNMNNGENGANENGQKSASKKGANKTMSEKKPEGPIRKFWNKHKGKILAFGGGVATGVGGTVLVGEIGKRRMQNQQPAIPPMDVNPLDPNL